MPKRVKKFEPGETFASFDDFAKWCLKGNYVFWGQKGRPIHGAFMMSMPCRQVMMSFKHCRAASVRQEWREANP